MITLKHLGLVGPLPPPFGGMANQTRQLAELLADEGIVVTQVATNADYRPRWIAGIPGLRALFRLIPYVLALRKVSKEVDVMHVMANSGWSWHLFAAPAVWIAKFCKTPVVVNYHGGEAESFLAQSAGIIRTTMRQTSALVVPSGFLQNIFSRYDIQSSIVANVIDPERFAPNRTRSGPLRHLLVARNLEPIYDNETAIRAFALVHRQYPDATLTLAGSGPQAESLKTLVGDLGLANAVFFAGRLDKDAMLSAYRNADLAINPSLVDNMPVSVLEAMASGIPVVTTDVGGVPYLVTDEQTALLVPPKSPERMAEAVLRLMDDPGLVAQLVSNGLQEAQQYAWHHIWPKLAEVYSGAINKPRLPA